MTIPEYVAGLQADIRDLRSRLEIAERERDQAEAEIENLVLYHITDEPEIPGDSRLGGIIGRGIAERWRDIANRRASRAASTSTGREVGA